MLSTTTNNNNRKTTISANIGSRSEKERYCSIELELNKKDLLKQYPIKFMNKNKTFLYNLHKEQHLDCNELYNGNLIYCRYKAFQRPKLYKKKELLNKTKLIAQPNIFNYNEKVQEDSEENNTLQKTFHWYLNFSHSNLFVAWKGSLFAQDEIQVAEHPILGSLQQYLLSKSNQDTKYSPLTVQSGVATPILIKNVDRRVAVNVTDFNLYGNKFASANEDLIKQATTVIDPKTNRTSNIFALEAPTGGHGNYDLSTISYIFDTAYSGFRACKLESTNHNNKEEEEGLKEEKNVTIIHTGNWGTGAYGGSKELMALLQILAARLAGVDYLFYHAFSKEGVDAVEKAVEVLDKELGLGVIDENCSEEASIVSVQEILRNVEKKGYKWGFSDGN
ncbi:hypothetical protein ABK040_011093 [Willaertia magna]